MALTNNPNKISVNIEVESEQAKREVEKFADSLSTSLGKGSKDATAAVGGMDAGMKGLLVTGGIVATGIVAAFAVMAVGIAATVKLTEGMIDTAEKVGTKSKDDFDKFNKSVKESHNVITETDRALSQQLIATLDQVKAATDSLFVVLIRESGPALIVMLQNVVTVLNDLQPAAHSVGQMLSWAFNAGSGAIAALREAVRLIKNDLNDLMTQPFAVTMAQIFGAGVAGFEKAKADVAAFKPTPAKFDSKGGGGKGGEKDLTAGKLRIAQLEEEAKDAQRVYDQETADLKEQLQQRFISQEEYADKAIQLEKDLLAKKIAVIAAEETEANKTKLPNKRAAELLKVQEKEKQLRADFGAAINKINKDQAASEAKDDAEFAAQKKKAYEREEKDLLEYEKYVREVYRREADLYSQRQRLRVELEASFIGTRQQAIAKLGRLDEQAALREYERKVEDNQREIDLLQKQQDLEGDEEENRLGKIRALNDEIVAAEADKEAKINFIRRQSIIEQQRNQPNSDLNLFGERTNDALNALEVTNAIVGKQTTLWERVRAAMRAYVQDLKSVLPSGYQIAIQTFQAMGKAMSENISAYLTGQKTLRQAIGSIVDAMLEPYKKYCEIKAAIQFAEAAGDFAYGNIAGGLKHLAVGVLWSGLAGLIGAAGGLIGGSAGGGAAAATGNNANANNQNNGPRVINQSTTVGQNQLIIRVEPGIIVDHVVADYKNNGQLRQLVQKEK